MRPTIFRSVPRCLVWAVASLAAGALRAQSPEVEPGQHEYVIWLYANDEDGELLPLTGAQKAKYCATAQEFARRTYDVTNGRHTIRKVTFYYDVAPPVGPYHVTWRRWHATPNAPGSHIIMYDEDLGCRSNWTTEDGAVVRLPGTCPEGLTCENNPDRPRCRNDANETVPGSAVAWGWVLSHETDHANYDLPDEYLYPIGEPEDYLHICNNPETNTSHMAHRDRDHWCDSETHLHQRWILGYGSSAGPEDVQVTEPSLAGYNVWTDAQATWMDLTDYVLGEYEDDPAPAFVPADDLCAFTGPLADATPANDTMVVVDKSGSMGFKNSDSPMEPTALETAFLAGLAHYNAIPLGGRNVGLLLFDTAVTEVLPYEPRTEAQTADLFTSAPGGNTDLCLAVNEGAERVRTSGATMPRGTVVLLTDGRPTVPACGDEEAVLTAVLDACLGDPPVDVWPVAFGDAEYVLMSRIAEACGTQALWIEKDEPGGQEDTFEIQAALLRQGYRARSYREVLFDRSPTVADHTRTFAIPPGTAELEVAWVGEPFEQFVDPDVGDGCRFGQLAFELLDPDGIPQGIDPVPPASEATYHTRTRRVLRPAAGVWTMRATAGADFFCVRDSPSYQGYVPKLASLAQIRASTAFAEVEVSGPVVARNEALLVTAVLHADDVSALTGIEVTAEVANDAGSTPVTLRDDGAGGDEVAGDGRYTGRFNDCGGAMAPGAYRVAVKLQADEATATSVVSPGFDFVLAGGAPQPGPAISATLREERAVAVANCLSAEEAQRCGAPAPPPAAQCPRPVLDPATPGIEIDPGETVTDVEICLDGIVLVERGVRVGLGPGVTASNVRVDYDPVAGRTCILFDATADEDAPGGDIGVTVTFGEEKYETEDGEPAIVVSGSGPAWSFHLGVADPRGSLANEFGMGPSAAIDYSVPIGSGLSWDFVLGWSRFDPEATGDDLDVWDLAANLAFRQPFAGAWWWQVHGGPELFLVDGSDFEGGFDVGAGLGFDLQPDLSLEAAWSRHVAVTASPKVEFDSFRLGLLWSF